MAQSQQNPQAEHIHQPPPLAEADQPAEAVEAEDQADQAAETTAETAEKAEAAHPAVPAHPAHQSEPLSLTQTTAKFGSQRLIHPEEQAAPETTLAPAVYQAIRSQLSTHPLNRPGHYSLEKTSQQKARKN